MAKKNKWILGVLVLVIIIIGGIFGYNYYKENRPVGIYRMDVENSSKHHHYKLYPAIYIRLKKNKKVNVIMTSTTHKGEEVPGSIWYGHWRLKNDKVVITYVRPKAYGMSGSNTNTSIYKIKKNGALEEVRESNLKDYFNKKDAISEEKFNKYYKKYKEDLDKLRSESNKDNNFDSDQNNSQSNNNEENTSDEDSGQNVDPDEIGRAVYARVFPSEQVDSVEKDGDSYYVSNEYHSADSTVEFQINGDTVTYWTQSADDTTAGGKNDAHTVKIEDLLGN